jgi:hypothetical protein
LRIDLGRWLPAPVRRAASAAGRVDAKLTGVLQGAEDRVLAPRASARLRGCTVACEAEVTGVADLLRLELSSGHEGGTAGFDVALARLRVFRPDGEAEACVRQHIPPAARATFGPGLRLPARAHPTERAVAVLQWPETVATAVQYAWPDHPDWPAPGRIEVRDKGRYQRRLAERRAQWTAARATLAGGRTRGALTDSRVDWKLDLVLDGHPVRVAERVPQFAAARLFAPGPTARVGTPVLVLRSPAGELAVDWEATLNDG